MPVTYFSTTKLLSITVGCAAYEGKMTTPMSIKIRQAQNFNIFLVKIGVNKSELETYV
jgi:hypothetical protein